MFSPKYLIQCESWRRAVKKGSRLMVGFALFLDARLHLRMFPRFLKAEEADRERQSAPHCHHHGVPV